MQGEPPHARARRARPDARRRRPRVRLGTHEWAGGVVDPLGYGDSSVLAGRRAAPLAVADRRRGARARARHACTADPRRGGAPARASRRRPSASSSTPLCTWRDAHGERRAGADPTVETTADGFVVEGAYRVAGPAGRPADVVPGRARTARRPTAASPTREDLWHAGTFVGDAARPAGSADVVGVGRRPRPGATGADEIVAGTAAAPAASWRPRGKRRRRRRLLARRRRVRRLDGDGPDVVAGYPWFGAWSRDTMISYEGLFLATGPRRGGPGPAAARTRRRCPRGCSPTPPTPGGLEYNTADGTLWFLHAVGRHVAVTGDTDLARRAAPARSTGSSTRTSPAPGTASGSTRPTGCSPRAPPAWR